MEFDLAIPWNGMLVHIAPKPSATAGSCCDQSAIAHSFFHIDGTSAGVRNAAGEGGSFMDPRAALGVPEDEEMNGKMVRVRIQVDGRYGKVYLNEKRVANIPNADFGRGKQIIFETTASDGDHVTLIGDISINAGGRDMYDALMADGRVVTQGVYFDVGSDRIRPESGPSLKLIGDMLKAHADLKLSVEGHTDNTGSAATNQALSEKRAQAIVNYLTATVGITPGRLSAKGLGASKPAASNDTPEGRQQNRRVELVKM
jgi:outer membrane protein OmpA-like peptidoglycan-associated protein